MSTTYHESELKFDRGLYHTPDGHFLIDAFGQYCLIKEPEKANKLRMLRRNAMIISFIFATIGVALQLGYGHSLLHHGGQMIVPMFAAFTLYLAAFLTFLFFNLWLRTKLPKSDVKRAPWRESFIIEARKGAVQEWLILAAWSLLFVLFLLVATDDIIASSIFALVGFYSAMSAYIHYKNP